LSQRDLASKVGVTETTMSRYINGTREPKIEILLNLSISLETTVDELIGNQDVDEEKQEYPQIKRLLARNSKNLTMTEKKELINVLLSEEE
jgi:transcriptional regulator with XRE-family HTH domain